VKSHKLQFTCIFTYILNHAF